MAARGDESGEYGAGSHPVVPPDVTLVLLAGGRGSRMGKPKDRVRIGGHGLVEWMLGRVAWRGPTMLVGPSDRSHVEGEEQVDMVVHDHSPGEGPLLGIKTAQMWCRTPGMVVVPIDMPGLGARHIAWVVERAKERPGAAAVMLRRKAESEVGGVGGLGEKGREQIEPFPSFYRPEFVRIAARRLEEGNRAMRTLVHESGVEVVDAPAEWEEWVWSNLNREEDVARFERGIARLAAEGGRCIEWINAKADLERG